MGYDTLKEENLQTIRPKFRGCILLSPAVLINAPGAAMSFVLEWVMVPLFPKSRFPFSNPDFKKHSWKDQEIIDYVSSDGYPQNPLGLGWSQPVRYRTGYSILKMCQHIAATLPAINFPFVLLHVSCRHASRQYLL